jgi:hypothetical protein
MDESNALISIKRYALGQIYFGAKGPEKYRDMVEKALQTPGVCQVQPYISKPDFVKAMKNQGIPESAIQDFINGIWIDDEHICVRPDSTW